MAKGNLREKPPSFGVQRFVHVIILHELIPLLSCGFESGLHFGRVD